MTPYDEAWRAMQVTTQGEVRLIDDVGLSAGEIRITPGIPNERRSSLIFKMEGHTLELQWDWNRLSTAPGKPLLLNDGKPEG